VKFLQDQFSPHNTYDWPQSNHSQTKSHYFKRYAEKEVFELGYKASQVIYMNTCTHHK